MALAGAARGLCGRLAYGGAARWPNYYALGTCDSLQGVLVSGGARGAKTETKAEKKAKAVQKDEQQSSSLGGKVQQMMKVLEPQKVPQAKLSAGDLEEHKQRGKEFSRKKMAEHRAWQKALSEKLRLKLAAIEALPVALREHAASDDFEPFPLNRWVATDTPPIEGYYESKSGVNDRSKRRR
uniref:Large ribosomal subunit protein mL40 n=1 Tax=Tetraselmis chuii TaxID=63592 RepID=A0A7S1SH10_9CHLO|mmetsp:Transcript_10445/g.18931  ORF Transcript_10445/g.18931 Transcript_10445/m.18931 type:complete len:182 (+) Transcript_10445:49-594(+)|eukprot:CAMPEP_0177779966 /NCGR_PEP_ID=MMETSP0491_2-20121128/16930_1 /TAXON_ID=63592 /ORGANISM="Tetraselmis chuii, Strain PLY429" /LENGTH=181 /DNA_ID=CAMNT_0019299663 /DNA_START=144 /DNA_END=689 /DNA_ORIENTATION=+